MFIIDLNVRGDFIIFISKTGCLFDQYVIEFRYQIFRGGLYEVKNNVFQSAI